MTTRFSRLPYAHISDLNFSNESERSPLGESEALEMAYEELH